MSEYIIYWDGIGSQLTDMLSEHVPQCLWPKRIRQERLREKIVRCRNCGYYERDGETSEVYPDRHWCDKLTVYMPPSGFCSFGERREP